MKEEIRVKDNRRWLEIIWYRENIDWSLYWSTINNINIPDNQEITISYQKKKRSGCYYREEIDIIVINNKFYVINN